MFKSGFFRRLGKLRGPRRLLRDEGGVAAVEFAFVALPFFLLIGAIIETALVFLADQMLETAVNDAARLIRTGQAQSSLAAAPTTYSFKTEICNRIYLPQLITCADIVVNAKTVTDFSSVSTSPPLKPDGSLDTASSIALGSGSQIVVVSAYYAYPLIFNQLGLNLNDIAQGKRLLGAVTAFRNEPFP